MVATQVEHPGQTPRVVIPDEILLVPSAKTAALDAGCAVDHLDSVGANAPLGVVGLVVPAGLELAKPCVACDLIAEAEIGPPHFVGPIPGRLWAHRGLDCPLRGLGIPDELGDQGLALRQVPGDLPREQIRVGVRWGHDATGGSGLHHTLLVIGGPVVGDKEPELVLDEVAANIKSEIRGPVAYGQGRKGSTRGKLPLMLVGRLEALAFQVVEYVPGEFIAPTLRECVDDASRGLAVLGLIPTGLHLEFLDELDGDRLPLPAELHIRGVDAIHHPVVLHARGAIDLDPLPVLGHTRGQLGHAAEIPGDRKGLHRIGGIVRADRGALDVHGCARIRHLHRSGGNGSHLHVHRGRLVQSHLGLGLGRVQPLLGRGDRADAGRDQSEAEGTGRIREGAALPLEASTNQQDPRSNDGTPLGVENVALQAAGGLGEKDSAGDQQKR